MPLRHFVMIETILVASDDREPTIHALVTQAISGFSDSRLVETIGNVTSDRIGTQLREGGFDVEFRHLDTLVPLIEDRCRVGSDFAAIVLSTLRPYRGMNERLKGIARQVRNLDERICLPSGVRARNIPIVIALALEMASLESAPPPEGRFAADIAWCSVRRPGRSFAQAVSEVIRDWRRDVYLQLDYVGYALGFNEAGELEISPVLRRTRRASHLFSESALPHSLGEGGMILSRKRWNSRWKCSKLREICGNLANVASRMNSKPELVVHRFLDEHPEILYRGEFERHWSETYLAAGTRPDFVLSGSEKDAQRQRWEVLELKRPDEVLLRKREFAKAVVRGFEQLHRYRTALCTTSSRERQEKLLAAGAVVAPRMCLLIGRSFDPELTAEVQETHRSSAFNDISLMTYDELAHPMWRRVNGLKQRLLEQTGGL